jgi:predicted PurR-regulated permease PerM
MEIFIIVFLCLVIGVLVYGIVNTLNKLEYYENFISNRREKYIQLLNSIREIDSKELFEKDDDVGSVFTQIKDEIESFENILE